MAFTCSALDWDWVACNEFITCPCLVEVFGTGFGRSGFVVVFVQEICAREGEGGSLHWYKAGGI